MAMFELKPFEFKIEGIEEAKKMVSKDLFNRILSKTVKDTAYDARKDLIREIEEIFDRPTPFILKSVGVRHKEYDPSGLSALIGFFMTGGKRRDPSDILEPHIKGGSRRKKPSEELLHNYWIPTRAITKNKYGNVSGGQMTQILSAQKAFHEVGYMANVTPESRKRNKRIRNYFKVGWTNRAGLRAGIWERLSNGRIRPLLLFIRDPQYFKRFKFTEIVSRSIKKNIQRRFDDAFRLALTGIRR